MSDTSTRRLVPDLKSFAPSVVRSLTPIVVAYFSGWPVTKLLGLDDDRVTSLVTAVLFAAYYLLVRLAEQYVLPQAGWLLGWASAPVYVPVAASGATATPATDVVKVVTEHAEGR